MDKSTSRVVVIGAGPTGLTLALLLARSGISSTLVEKNARPQAHPAACILNTRTMEVFREIGVADLIMRQGQNVFERAYISWVTSLAGRELGRCSAMPEDLPSLLARILKGAILPIYRLNSRGPPTATTFILVAEDRAKTSSAECSRLGEAGPLF